MTHSLLRIPLAAIHASAPDRAAGYLPAILTASQPDGETHIRISPDDYQTIATSHQLKRTSSSPSKSQTVPENSVVKPSLAAGGAGSQLKKLLTHFGFKMTKDCLCQLHADEMDRNGIAWCDTHRPTIIGWLRTEAKAQGWPFSTIAANILLGMSISRARRHRAHPANPSRS